jgi:putative transposase
MPQSLACLNCHIIFSTKNREPLLTHGWTPRLYEYIGGILRTKNCSLLAAGGMADHLHVLVSFGKQISIADVVRDIKSNSSHWIHESFDSLHGFAWQSGYGAFTVSASNLGDVKRYIANQTEHHKMHSFQEEFLAFLERHEIEYDERYLWE